jgi:long-chain fatty acid transport protein
MSYRGLKAFLLACSGIGVLLAATADANAGGLAVREQSSFGQGSSFAGVAAGGDLSSLFWNPATMTQVPGMQTEVVATGILPYAANTVGAGSTAGILGGTGNTGVDALVPSFYTSYQVNPSLWLGLSFNAPFGLSVSFPDLWAGRDYAANSTSLKTYNATPSVAYKVNDWISVGAGVQIQYAKASLSRGVTLPGPTFVDSNLSGDGWAWGFTAGATLTPTPNTTVGIGYRSALNQKIDGSLTLTGPLTPFSNPNISTTVNLPGILSVGLRQKLTPQFTLLSTVEWTNWSRIGTSNVNAAVAGIPVKIPFEYQDGWFFSLGGEYQWDPQLTLRAGAAYEISPITDQVRIPLLPDNDRIWLSMGATYRITKALTADFAYSHIFVKDAPIDVGPGNPSFNPALPIVYIGTANSHIDIVSLALKYRWDDPAPAPVLPGYYKAK